MQKFFDLKFELDRLYGQYVRFEEARKEWRAESKKIKPEEWLELFIAYEKTVPENELAAFVRAVNILWWDIFGGRSFGEKTDHFDRYLNHELAGADHVDTNKVALYLRLLGYPDFMAENRSAPGASAYKKRHSWSDGDGNKKSVCTVCHISFPEYCKERLGCGEKRPRKKKRAGKTM